MERAQFLQRLLGWRRAATGRIEARWRVPAARLMSAMLLLAGLLAALAAAGAEFTGASPDAGAADAGGFAIHGQLTYVEQETDGFHAPYRGPNSLSPASGRETTDITLYVGARLWAGAEAWINPELDQGFGLDDTLGVAGFPSGEAYKVGADTPYLRVPRAYLRQTLNTGGDCQSVDGQANQLRASRCNDRWVITLGKFGVTDIFDTNQYAHDPRSDFFNWAALDAGTFDYAADAWGYTVGLAVERYLGSWTYRAGVFDLSDIPNSETLEHGLHEFQMEAEIEKRYALLGQTGRVLLTAFESRARMGLFDQAIALAQATGTTPSTAAVRQYRSRPGGSLGIGQPLSADLGVFARLGKAAGNVETYEFADIDRSVEIGASWQGARWHRPQDVVGLAALDNGASAERERYLALGGLGILVGDGRLPHPAAEQILETYYNCAVASWAHVTLDYQWVRNPAYNSDRGPVSIFAVRVHAEF
jgi:high affinity Mn2+ porin